MLVVNWFQNFVSLWSETVESRGLIYNLKLWIGFKILYLCGLKQFHCVRTTPRKRCELVSKFCIFVVWNSIVYPFSSNICVVNWFQNFVSLWSETVIWYCFSKCSCCELVSKFCIFVVWNSGSNKSISTTTLWIGFKILYLCGLKQYIWYCFSKCSCCELVSKFCIFVVWNSIGTINQAIYIVVNWFQNFVSLWSETVYHGK